EDADLRAEQERQRDVRQHLPVGAEELVGPVHGVDVLAHRRATIVGAGRAAYARGVSDAARKRFAETAALVAEAQDRRAAETSERLRTLLTLTGEERALDVGTGAGALAIALAPLVREVVGVDLVPELLDEGRKRAPENVELLEAEATALPFELGS